MKRVWLSALGVMLMLGVAGADWKLWRTETKTMEQAVSFAPDGKTGYIAGIGSIARTTNGGRSFRQVVNRQTFGEAYWFNAVRAFSADEAVASGYIYGKPQGGLVVRTTDGGNTWQRVRIPGNGEVKFSGLAFTPDGKTGYVLAEQQGLYRSTDRGRTWSRVELPLTPDRFWIATKRSIALPDEKTVVVWGTRNTLLRSDDGGKSWRTLKIELPGVIFDVLQDLYFATPDRGWVSCGWDGQQAETFDGGKTWRPSAAPGWVLLAPDGRNGWSYQGRSYEVATTADGGRTWSSPTAIFGGQGGISMMTVAGSEVIAVGGQEGTGLSFVAAQPLPGAAPAEELAAGVIPISFVLPAPGAVSIQILDAQGEVVENLGNGMVFPAGRNTIYWNLSTVEDFWPPFEPNNPHQYRPPAGGRRVAPAGKYTWRGVWHPELKLTYRDCYYPIKPAGVPWTTADHRGGWLGDHEPPNDVIDGGDRMWLGAFAEGGDSLLESDLAMNKRWGVSRIQLACARVLAVQGEKLYFLDLGGWLGHGGQLLAMIEVDRKSKASRRVLSVALKDPEAKEFAQPPEGVTTGDFAEISGLAVIGDRGYLSDRGRNRILVLDLADNLAGKSEKIKILESIPVAAPGRIRPYGRNQLAVAAKNALWLLDLTTRKLTRVVDGLVNGYGLAVDPEGNFYVGELEPLHQVKVFDRQGRLLRTVGKPGPHQLGKFDPDNLESPTGLAVDQTGRLWVCEHSFEIKRTSVWDRNGKCVRAVFGPTEYGGGGAVDPRNPERFFYRGNEVVRTAPGRYQLKNLFWRHDTDRYVSFAPERRAHNFNGPAPAYPFYRGNQLFFRMWGGYGMGDLATLFVYDEAGQYARPVAAAGQVQPWMRQKFAIPAEHDIFAWSDLNDDSQVTPEELRTGRLGVANAVWGCTMGENFEVAFSSLSGPVGLAFFEVEKLTPQGYPVYRLPTAYRQVPNLTVHDPNQVQAVAMDAHGNAVAVSPYIFSMNKSGRVNWRYVCRWPGLHSGLGSTALGNEPGVMIAPLRIWGVAEHPAAGQVIAIGSNYGVVDFLSGEGFYLGRAFVDSRLGRSWRFERVPTPEELKRTSLGQEHFGGAYQRVGDRDLLVVAGGGTTSVVVEVEGLNQLRKLSGGALTVTPAQFAAADRLRQAQQAASQVPKEYLLTPGRDWAQKTAIEGFKLGYDAQNLYVRYEGEDELAPFRNAATSGTLAEAFTTGDVLDLMLTRNPDADPARTGAAAGDLRISIVPQGEGAVVLLYDYVVPGAPESGKLRFSSPVGGTVVDRFTVLRGATTTVHRDGRKVTVETTIPLAEIGLQLKPGMRLGGDVGRVVSDQTGSTRIDRVYWSNRNTRIVKDLPSEARLQPNLWGTFLVK